MYGLVQAVIIAHKDPKKHLHPFGYEPATIMLGLWRHNKRGITFTLVIDDVGIK